MASGTKATLAAVFTAGSIGGGVIVSEDRYNQQPEIAAHDAQIAQYKEDYSQSLRASTTASWAFTLRQLRRELRELESRQNPSESDRRRMLAIRDDIKDIERMLAN